MLKRIITGMLLLLLCGCIKTKDDLTLNANGSGSVRIETRSTVSPDISAGMGGGMFGFGQAAIYPPLTEDQAQRFFPKKNFTVTFKQQKGTNNETVTVIEARFKDVNALLASPYGRVHQLTITRTNGALSVKAVSGLEGLARFSEMKSDSGLGFSALPGLAALKNNTNHMQSEFRITLPNPITQANGTHQGKTAVWTADRGKSKDAADFDRQLGRVLEARCPDHGVTLAPVNPTRLALAPFDELATGAASGTEPLPDTNKIAAAAKFVPYQLSVTRSVDLSGEGGMQQNVAQLVGAVVLPRSDAPQKWGRAMLDEAVDAKGNDLKPNASDRSSFLFNQSVRWNLAGDDQEESGAASDQLRHVVSLAFRPPDWSVKKIARIKGGVSLYYFGNAQVVKLTNAIPANWIMDMAGMMGGGFNNSEKTLNSTRLADLGLTLSVQMAMSQNGMTTVILQSTGEQASLADVQVFDAKGKPWPTFFSPMAAFGENGSYSVIVPGKPEAPLSLALLASGAGTTVEVPISMNNVSVTQN